MQIYVFYRQRGKEMDTDTDTDMDTGGQEHVLTQALIQINGSVSLHFASKLKNFEDEIDAPYSCKPVSPESPPSGRRITTVVAASLAQFWANESKMFSQLHIPASHHPPPHPGPTVFS
jgi:hypothetical protein